MVTGVVVVGMHRSGTSAVTRVVNLLGAHLGRADDLYRAPDNPSGHWESVTLCRLNDTILRVFGGYDMGPPPLPPGWPASRPARDLRPVLGATFHDVFRRDPWVWKDPRLCLTLPLWREVLPPFCAVLVVRAEPAVTASLHAREGFPRRYCRALWEHHNRAALAALAGLPTAVVDFDEMQRAPLREVGRLHDGLRHLGVPLDGEPDAAASSVRPVSRRATPPQSRSPLEQQLRALPALSASFRPPATPGRGGAGAGWMAAGRLVLRTEERLGMARAFPGAATPTDEELLGAGV